MIGLLLGTAWAGFGVHTSREPLPARENEKAVTLPKGWTELELAVDRAVADEAWSAEGQGIPLDGGWRTTTLASRVRYGLGPGWEVFGQLPWRHARGEVTQSGFATAEIGTRIALERSEAPFHSVGLEIAGRLPLGFDGGSADGTGPVPLTTGTGDLRVAVDARRGVDGLVLLGRAGWMRRFGGQVAWHDGRVKPGDQVFARAEVLLQAGPLGFGPRVDAVARGPVRTSDGDGALFPVRASAGASLDVGGRLFAHLTRGIELEARLGWAVVGQDDTFVRIDELHPARSRTAGLSTRARW